MVAQEIFTLVGQFCTFAIPRTHARRLVFCCLLTAGLLPLGAMAAEPVVVGSGGAVQPDNAGEQLYVGDTLRVGVRATPGSASAPLEVVLTGAALKVLGHQGRYVRVRTPAGNVGWVNGAYLSEHEPAARQLVQVRERNTALQQKLAALQTALSGSRQVRQSLEREQSRLLVAQRTLQEQVAGLQAQLAREQRQAPAWFYWLLVILAAAGGCFAVGALWHRGRVARRLGGLRL